ncbi:DUF1203 domain-containing protein [Streptomyces sp. BHT-5-2]|uniref:DUF1203 domain-containing protein n=1 Tax=Streptomyces sp. BHT-5-2 TaxID=2866715 RepID=UPI001C8D7E5D|nr:DUF1203 domain-containing protein [Streptomyces sp. BHT-5-2]QZL04835.1 DUF1203 domain-containing protein [Streptomyces sp. BHT-5-2]
MTRNTVLPVDATVLKELRVADDAGRPCAPYVATPDDEGSPLRCCLRPITPGERIALVSYAPLRRWAAATGADPGAYDEQGPVFIHADDCGGFTPGENYPFDRPGALRTVRRYDARGHIAGGRLLEIPAEATAGFDAAFDDAFGDPDVVLVHVRALEYGCFHFEVRRPAAEE